MARYISPLSTDTEVNNCYLTLFIYAIYFMSKLWIFFFHSQGEPDTLSLWMDLLYLDSVNRSIFRTHFMTSAENRVILVIVTCNCLPFSYWRSIFRTHFMTRAENSFSEPPNLKIFGGRIPPDPPTKFVLSTLAKTSFIKFSAGLWSLYSFSLR